jgi:hypothetical protein
MKQALAECLKIHRKNQPFFALTTICSLICCGLTASVLLSSRQVIVGIHGLSSAAGSKVFQYVAIYVPLWFAIAVMFWGCALTCYNVIGKNWPRRELIMIPLYLLEFCLVVLFIGHLGFCVFD